MLLLPADSSMILTNRLKNKDFKQHQNNNVMANSR